MEEKNKNMFFFLTNVVVGLLILSGNIPIAEAAKHAGVLHLLRNLGGSVLSMKQG